MKKLVFLVVIATVLSSCNDNTNKTVIGGAITEAKDVTKIKTSLKLYDDSVNVAWKELNAADSLKVATIGRLVQEISYIRGTIAPNEYKLVTTKLSEVKAQKLTYAQMSDVSALANYDLISDTLLVKTLDLTAKIKKQKKVNALVDELAADAQAKDDAVLLRRISYDNSAKAYNNYFMQNKEELSKADSTLSNQPLKAYFNPENPI